MTDVKQVIVIRRFVGGIRRGKECAQASHASLAFLVDRINRAYNCYSNLPETFRRESIAEMIWLTPIQLEWCITGMTKKVVLQVQDEAELLEIYQKAKEAKLEAHLVIDSGKTEFDGVATTTCCAIGPDYSDRIDKITGHLKLY